MTTPLPPERRSVFDIFYEAQTRLGSATHTLATQAKKLAAARALGQDMASLFDELEILIMVENREREAAYDAHAALQKEIRASAPLIPPYQPTGLQAAQ